MENLKVKKSVLLSNLAAIAIMTLSGFISFNSQKDQKGVVATLHHVGLSVNDLEKLKKWYSDNFALAEEQKFEMEEPKIRTVMLLAKNGFRVELIELKGSRREREFSDPLDACSDQGYGHLAIEVNNLDEAFNNLISGGAKLVLKPSPAVQKGAFFAYVKDPEGNLIELIQSAKK
jgi:catechol 2,3-dioxygenase-like lactoylglutathione lyase family enzyme